MTTYRFLPPLVQRHWTLMDHSHGLDRHSISSSWEVKSRAVCNWKHALFIQVFITLGLQGYSPSYRTRLQNLKQVSRTPCLLWLSLITRDSWESQKESDSVELVLQQRLKYPLVKEVLWSLQNTGTWHLADTQYTGLRIEFHFFLLKLVIMSMFIIQNFNISIHFNKPCLKKKKSKSAVAACGMDVTLRRWFCRREGLAGNTAIKPFMCSSQLYCEGL